MPSRRERELLDAPEDATVKRLEVSQGIAWTSLIFFGMCALGSSTALVAEISARSARDPVFLISLDIFAGTSLTALGALGMVGGQRWGAPCWLYGFLSSAILVALWCLGMFLSWRSGDGGLFYACQCGGWALVAGVPFLWFCE